MDKRGGGNGGFRNTSTSNNKNHDNRLGKYSPSLLQEQNQLEQEISRLETTLRQSSVFGGGGGGGNIANLRQVLVGKE